MRKLKLENPKVKKYKFYEIKVKFLTLGRGKCNKLNLLHHLQFEHI